MGFVKHKWNSTGC